MCGTCQYNTNIILCDTRQKVNSHGFKHKFFENHGIEMCRTKLVVGDYQLPGGKAAVDTKKDLLEFASNLRQDHERFRRECELAQKLGIQLYVLVENSENIHSLSELADWKEPNKTFYMRRSKNLNAVRISGKQLARAAKTMSEKYNVKFSLCTPFEAGRRVIEILEGHEQMRIEGIRNYESGR